MRLVKYLDPNSGPRLALLDDDGLHPFTLENGIPSINEALIRYAEGPNELAVLAKNQAILDPEHVTILAPIDRHEVWGAGVTYLRSKIAREQESESAATFYDQVYEADRPELFFKATPSRVVGPQAPIRIRSDSTWSVPEPELGLVLTPDLRLAGYTLGNDVSARDIEGRNPLYLPQAKVYDSCCALGPWILFADSFPSRAEVEIRLRIVRQGDMVFEGACSLERLTRSFEELVSWLGRDNHFPEGVVLLTGTGIVPPDDLSLEAGDVVEIRGTGLGVLRNPVVTSRA